MKFFRKNIIYLLLLGVLAALFLIPGAKDFLKDRFFPVAAIEEAVHVEDTAYDIVLKGINVPDANFKDFKGKKTVFLNFWGTWCAPCREEWPTIEALYESRKDKMDFVLIAMMDKEEDVRKFVEDKGYTAPVYLAESPISGKILPKVFPTTFILDKNGRILLKETSSKDWNTEAVHQFMDRIAP